MFTLCDFLAKDLVDLGNNWGNFTFELTLCIMFADLSEI